MSTTIHPVREEMELADTLRFALERQQANNDLQLYVGNENSRGHLYVSGRIDLRALAGAILREGPSFE